MIRKEEALKKIQNFIIENKDAPTVWRSELVRGLTEELESEGFVPALYWLWKMKHPALLRKGAAPQTIGEILADFILNISEVAERKAEYPVLGPERAHRNEKRREARELLIRFERDDDSDNQPPGTVYEDSFVDGNPVEEQLFDERCDMSAEELIDRLETIKRSPGEFIGKYADGTEWNRETHDKRRTVENVAEAIERTDIRRVKVCLACGNAFYSHSKQPGRVKVCDTIIHLKFKPKTQCQVTRDRALAPLRKKRKKSSA
ncbi:hypothetical protein C7121_06270 [Paenibacillus glucanolyticus]|uniref:hypothetical protein n=1 Tax=Paenibacillus TaxID=44249 RepID=UPI0003E23D04|nr:MULTISPECIES: hypothetical protein [Paenibacillus]ANA80161.1 hypothetical protein A3958_09270 [Paenibacillus glucanolyticus]AVV55772.1 hypothetical protein C7121_06270 [Paenibacillus glucanolyticus]ETT38570.1 hypothetical protein C169_13207 [Paenibacillus sp. FSL R5-808]